MTTERSEGAEPVYEKHPIHSSGWFAGKKYSTTKRIVGAGHKPYPKTKKPPKSIRADEQCQAPFGLPAKPSKS